MYILHDGCSNLCTIKLLPTKMGIHFLVFFVCDSFTLTGAIKMSMVMELSHRSMSNLLKVSSKM